MPTPFPSRQAAPTSWSGTAKTRPTTSNAEWRCTRCDKLLGLVKDDRLHLRFARQHEYHAALPASCTCRGCGALNELTIPSPPRAA